MYPVRIDLNVLKPMLDKKRKSGSAKLFFFGILGLGWGYFLRDEIILRRYVALFDHWNHDLLETCDYVFFGKHRSRRVEESDTV